MRFAVLLFALILVHGDAVGEVMRWVDENGVVNYGTVVPKQYRKDARPVAVQAPPSEAQRQEAENRQQRDRASVRRSSVSQAAPSPSKAGSSPAQAAAGAAADSEQAASPLEPTGSCRQQWREYDASYACFDPYRVKDGGIKAEAFEHCKEVKMPDCSRPSDMR